MNLLTVLAFTVMFALADRICGGPRLIPRIKLPGLKPFSIINDVWVPFALMGGTWQLTENVWLTATLPLAFAIWRGPGWKMFGGSLAPMTPKEVRGTFQRHLLALPLTAALWPATTPLAAILMPLSFAAVATILAYWAGQQNLRGKNTTELMEWMRGAAMGLLIGVIITATAYPGQLLA